jgi:outer membrane biosynthesis protein TonB
MTLQFVAVTTGLVAPIADAQTQETFQYRNTRNWSRVDQTVSAGLPSAGAAGRDFFGDVKLDLSIHRDGSVESADVVSGHAMLKQAALEGARRSQFECRGCNYRYRRIPLDSYSSCETTATAAMHGRIRRE